MSHEMRTPLNSIIGYSQRLLSKISDTSSREYDALTTINKNGQRLLDHVAHIMKLVEVEDIENLEDTHTNISQLKEAISATINRLSNNKATFDWHISNTDLALVGSTEWTSNIVAYLCNETNFPVQAPIEISASIAEQFCIVSVSFESNNIDADAIDALFNESEGLINPTATNYEGSNLNFAILKSMVQKLSGKLHATSQANKITYQVFLPLA